MEKGEVMKTFLRYGVAVAALCAFTVSAQATVLIDEQFESGYNRTSVYIANSNMAWFKGRSNTSATVNVGSLSFSTSSSSGASGYWGYFTDPAGSVGSVGSASSVTAGHLALGIGDKLTVSIGFSLGTIPASTSAGALRFGLLDSAAASQVPDQTRFTVDANSGPSNGAFINDPGYGAFLPLTSATALTDQINLNRRTTFTSSNLMSTAGDWTSLASVGGAYNPLSSGVNYTFNYSVARLDASTWELSASIVDTLSQTVMTSGSAQTASGQSSFDWIIWRMPAEAVGNPDVFTDLKVEVVAIPEPSTLVLVGAGLGMLFGMIRRRR